MTFSDSVLKRGSQGPPEQKRRKKETHLSCCQDPRRVMLGPFWRQIFNMALFLVTFGDFVGDSKKAVKRELSRGPDMRLDH